MWLSWHILQAPTAATLSGSWAMTWLASTNDALRRFFLGALQGQSQTRIHGYFLGCFISKQIIEFFMQLSRDPGKITSLAIKIVLPFREKMLMPQKITFGRCLMLHMSLSVTARFLRLNISSSRLEPPLLLKDVDEFFVPVITTGVFFTTNGGEGPDLDRRILLWSAALVTLLLLLPKSSKSDVNQDFFFLLLEEEDILPSLLFSLSVLPPHENAS